MVGDLVHAITVKRSIVRLKRALKGYIDDSWNLKIYLQDVFNLLEVLYVSQTPQHYTDLCDKILLSRTTLNNVNYILSKIDWIRYPTVLDLDERRPAKEIRDESWQEGIKQLYTAEANGGPLVFDEVKLETKAREILVNMQHYYQSRCTSALFCAKRKEYYED